MTRHIFHASKSKHRRGLMYSVALLALFIFLAVTAESKVYLWLTLLCIALFALLALYFLLYLRVSAPSLVVDNEGIQYRMAPSTVAVLPWTNIARIAIETSSASYRGRTFRARFISVYPHDYRLLKIQLPLLARAVARVNMMLGYAPIAIPEAMAGTTLESIMSAVSEFWTPNNRFQPTSALTRRLG